MGEGRMRAEIVSVGTELLLGMINDTNAQYLTQQLAELGIDVFWISQVGDNLSRVVEVLDRASQRSDAVIVTGGLGPTEDDLTRESLAALMSETMTVDAGLERELRDLFARRGRAMPERNLKQATLIPSARALPNPIGTAPGWLVERNGHLIAAMPGVPAEMKLMWESHVRPALKERAGASVLVTRTLRVLVLARVRSKSSSGCWCGARIRLWPPMPNRTESRFGSQPRPRTKRRPDACWHPSWMRSRTSLARTFSEAIPSPWVRWLGASCSGPGGAWSRWSAARWVPSRLKLRARLRLRRITEADSC
ncbi:MAG: competence/damage-inducible protein A [Chloroflexi bacterium]|nr:competence/damage-inducible protein A [Chloroflexota bacterium]